MPGASALDPRLSLAFDLYDACDLAADIGTDHALLPAALLQRGRCQKMILTDVSPAALNNARGEIIRCRLSDRAELRLGNGLEPLTEACGMISVTGMGGRTIRQILTAGADRLQGASLILSAHTDLPLIRQTIAELGYHLDREEPCCAAGRYYLVFRARPGFRDVSDRDIRLGSLLFSSASPCRIPYLRRRREVLGQQLTGLLSARSENEEMIKQVQSDLAFYDRFLQEESS